MQLNKYNFLRWFDSTPEPGLPDVPYPYWRDRENCGAMPIGLPGESCSWYMNIEEGLDATNYNYFADLRLALVRAKDDTVVNNNLAPLLRHYTDSPDNTSYNIYCTLVWPVVSSDIYYLKIYRATGGAEVFRSSYVWVRTDQNTLYNTTTLAKFRHDRYFYGILYGDLPGFHQQFRLTMGVLSRQYEGDKEVYKSVTTGKQRTLQNYLSRYCKLETYFFDPSAHEAAAILFDHKTIELNGNLYVPKSAYKEPENPAFKLGKGEIELWDEEFSTVNRC